MYKSYTDISQSKKLAEILPIESADMQWIKTSDSDNPDAYRIAVLVNSELIDKDDIPAWSLSALLELIQDDIKIEKTLFDQSDMFTYSIIGDAYQYSSYEHENLIDAAFEMVCWLKENKKI